MPKAQHNTGLSAKDAELEAVVERVIDRLGGKVPYFTREALREDFRLQQNYPAQFVAYIDRWHRRHLRRTVVATAATLSGIGRRVRTLPAAQQRKAQVRFVEDSQGSFSHNGSRS